MDQEPVITRASAADSQGLRDLFAICYGSESDRYPGPQEWQWRYANALQPSTIWIAKSDQQIVAQRPVVIKWVTVGGEHHRAAHFMDVMTHPDFRRRGLFTRLLSQATRELTEQEVSLCYSFPNEESFPGYSRTSDWTHLISPLLWVKPLRSDALLRQRLPNAHLRRAARLLTEPAVFLATRPRRRQQRAANRPERISRFDERFDQFCRAMGSEYDVMMRRDARHLNRRYFERPSVSYVVYASLSVAGQINGYIVLRRRSMFGMQLGIIVEMLAGRSDLQAARNLVAQAVDDLVAEDVDAIACVTPNHLPICPALRMEGFLRVPEWLAPRRFPVMVRPRPGLAIAERLTDPCSWFLSWGDNDAV